MIVKVNPEEAEFRSLQIGQSVSVVLDDEFMKTDNMLHDGEVVNSINIETGYPRYFGDFDIVEH